MFECWKTAYTGMVTANQRHIVLLQWTSRIARCLFWVGFHLVSRALLELCYSNLFMFKWHVPGLVKEAPVVGVHIGWKSRIPRLGGGGFSLCLPRRAHTLQKQSTICTWQSLMRSGYGRFEEVSSGGGGGGRTSLGLSTGVRFLTTQSVCMRERIEACACVWSALKRMHCFFGDGERWNSSTIVVYPGPITPSLRIILYRHSHHEPMTCVRQIKQGSCSVTAWDLRRSQHSALNRLQGHIFMTTVGLAVGCFRDTHTRKALTVLVVSVSMS